MENNASNGSNNHHVSDDGAFAALRRRRRVFSRIADAATAAELEQVLRSLSPKDANTIEEIRYAQHDEFSGFVNKLREYDETLADLVELVGDRVREEPQSVFDTRTAFGRIHAEAYLHPETRRVLVRMVMRRRRGADVVADQTLEEAMWMGRSIVYNVKCAMDEVVASVLDTQAVDLGARFEKHLAAAEQFLTDVRESYEKYQTASRGRLKEGSALTE